MTCRLVEHLNAMKDTFQDQLVYANTEADLHQYQKDLAVGRIPPFRVSVRGTINLDTRMRFKDDILTTYINLQTGGKDVEFEFTIWNQAIQQLQEIKLSHDICVAAKQEQGEVNA